MRTFKLIHKIPIKTPTNFMALCNKNIPVVGTLQKKWNASNKWDFDYI